MSTRERRMFILGTLLIVIFLISCVETIALLRKPKPAPTNLITIDPDKTVCKLHSELTKAGWKRVPAETETDIAADRHNRIIPAQTISCTDGVTVFNLREKWYERVPAIWRRAMVKN